MKTKFIKLNNNNYMIDYQKHLVVPGEEILADFNWGPNAVTVIDGKMYPNNTELIKVWDDKISELMDQDKIEEAWELFLTKPNKRDYPWIHHMDVELEEGRFDLCDFGADGDWNRNQIIDLEYFGIRLRDWIDSEYDEYVSVTNGKTHTRVKINQNPRFDKAVKKVLIQNNFGSMQYDW